MSPLDCAARPRAGQILTNRKTLSQFEELVAFEPLGELALKGFAKPVAAFGITGFKS